MTGCQILETQALLRTHQWPIPSGAKRPGTQSKRHLKVLKSKIVSSSFRFVNYSSLVLREDDTDVVEGAGESAVNWTKEAWVSSREGIQCLKDADGDTEKILDCRKNLHSSLDGEVQLIN